jgi:hypothetical protein
MAKLTLSIDSATIARAKRIAQKRKVSVSFLVEQFLTLLAQRDSAELDSPMLTKLRGALNETDPNDYTMHLVKKYQK